MLSFIDLLFYRPSKSSTRSSDSSVVSTSSVSFSRNSKGLNKLVHVAIDFGTTFSGYAFMFKHDFIENNLSIFCNLWSNVSQANINVKTPTFLLLNKDKTLHSFGHAAMDAYSEFCLDNKSKDYYFFMNFKMELHRERVSCSLLSESVLIFI